jgi:hypothetical protein
MVKDHDAVAGTILRDIPADGSDDSRSLMSEDARG